VFPTGGSGHVHVEEHVPSLPLAVVHVDPGGSQASSPALFPSPQILAGSGHVHVEEHVLCFPLAAVHTDPGGSQASLPPLLPSPQVFVTIFLHFALT